jgi:hypothetical protein
MIGPGKKKEKTGEIKKKDKKDVNEKEINLIETATELISEFISLLNIFTLYADKGAQCILTDSSKSNAQITVIDDIDVLKSSVYQDKYTKDVFLKILNGRLSGNADEPYPENVIDDVLDAMDSLDDKLIVNKIIMSQKKQYYTINEPDKLLEFINSELKPKEKEKKENGEVFTPLSLVNEMLDKLDEAYIKEYGKSIFTEVGFKWLDPAVGIGNFPIIVYQRLMKGLVTKIPNEEERRKHILEQMIYMVEISDKSIYILGKIFCDDKYKLNIHKGSFLDSKCSYDFMFDVVMGNPPYNPPKTETGSSGNSIWQQFVIKSLYFVKEKGFLTFIHPPGWKKPTDEIFDPQKLDILGGEYYKYDKKTGKKSIKQIRQGQVWQVLKDNGVFSFIYTNDQKNKKIKEYIPYFPAVDYYIYQKNGIKTTCNTKNIFLGETKDATGVKLNYELNYLPNLITNQTQHILHNVTTKEGKKTNFNRGIDERKINWNGKIINWVYDANKKGFQYKKHGINASSENGKTKEDTVGINKIILNFGGGISSYNVKYISTSEEIGVLDKTMYSIVETDLEGKCIERFFSSDIVKFIFLITQYASGAITQNETLVANSITIPPEDVDDYYAFFDIEKDKKYIEDILTHYYKGSKNPLIKEDEVEDETKTNTKEVEPKKTTIKLDEKIILVPATETTEDIPIAIPSPIPKKKRTIKKRLIVVKGFTDNKVIATHLKKDITIPVVEKQTESSPQTTTPNLTSATYISESQSPGEKKEIGFDEALLQAYNAVNKVKTAEKEEKDASDGIGGAAPLEDDPEPYRIKLRNALKEASAAIKRATREDESERYKELLSRASLLLDKIQIPSKRLTYKERNALKLEIEKAVDGIYMVKELTGITFPEHSSEIFTTAFEPIGQVSSNDGEEHKIGIIPITQKKETRKVKDEKLDYVSPIRKRKITIKKKLQNPTFIKMSVMNKVVPGKNIEQKSRKILTKIHVNPNYANLKKIQQPRTKRGGKLKKRTRKNKRKKY